MSIPFSAPQSDSPMNRIYIKRIKDLTEEVKTLKDKLDKMKPGIEAVDKMYQDYGAGQMTFYRVSTRGRVNIKAGHADHALNVQANYIGVNNPAQPTLALFKSQKSTVAEFNRMYTQGVMIQFKQNNDNRGYFNNSGSTTTYYDQGSDERLETNIEEWTEKVLPHFKAIKPKKFNWIEDEDGAPKIKGFIAQANLDKFPEAYHLNEDDRA